MGFSGSWADVWTSRTSRQQAANDFLSTGNISTAFGGTGCRGSNDCASGYACVNGRCVQKVSQESSTGGSCGGGTGGGGCGGNSIQFRDNEGNLITSGDVVSRQGTAQGVVYKTYAWTPVYSDDGCTVTGCTLAQCGGGFSDCPGERSCRYDAFGTVNCFCGEPEQKGCSSFCTAYNDSNGVVAAGCNDLSCDECSYCDEILVSASGVCRPKEDNVPCHCGGSAPDCYRCDEDGTVVPAPESCSTCVTISNHECVSCGETFNKTCCYTNKELESGLTAVNRCQLELAAQCDEACKKPDAKPDPCAGTCVPQKIGPLPGGCPELPPNQPSKRNVATGCIEAGGQGTLLYDECDLSDVPESCFLCDCNCDNDCPNCQVCNESTGKCVTDTADPNCVSINATSTWLIPGGSLFSGIGIRRCCTFFDVCNDYVNAPVAETVDSQVTTNAGLTPHTIRVKNITRKFTYGCYSVVTGNCTCPGGDCGPTRENTGTDVDTRWEVVDADGNVLLELVGIVQQSQQCALRDPVFTGGGTPSLVYYTETP